MTYKIVVARYNEDINWLKKQMSNCIIYNKGKKLNIQNEIMLPNIGRESHTYLNYIIENYKKLPDIVIFTQANISDHVKDPDKINYLRKLKVQARKFNKSRERDSYNILNPIQYRKDGSRIGNEWSPYWNLNTFNRDGNYFLENNYKNKKPIIFIEWFYKNIKPVYQCPFKIYSYGLFAVKKELILKHPIEYYKTLIEQVNHHINPTEGHFFERSWYYIFE
jgi:hypothetical protein